MSGSCPIATVAVVGSGITATSAAAALKRRIQSLEVRLVDAADESGVVAERIISTTPSIHGFHQDIGLSDADTITGAHSGLRVGTMFEGWSDGLAPYVQAYGPHGVAVSGVAFHQLWEREHRSQSLPPFDHFSPAAQLARSGASPITAPQPIQFGLQLTLERYAKLMRDYARHVGVHVRDAAIADVIIRPVDGFIERLVLDNGETVSADLFIDCTGPSALLRSKMDSTFVDWSKWLLNDRLIIAEGPADASLVTMDRATALPFGWRWAASSPQKSSRGLVYSSAHTSDDQVVREFGNEGQLLKLRQGRRTEPWVGNCVAIGDAAVTVEPLEWTNLHLAHSQIDRLISMMPGGDCAPAELFEFNRQCANEADRVRDFLCLHYVCSRRSEPFWKDAAGVTPPDSLAHSLSLFAERGRLPYYEEETFARDSWLAVLLCQGFEPRRVDPLADAVTHADAERAFAAMQQSLRSFMLPSGAVTQDYLNPAGIR